MGSERYDGHGGVNNRRRLPYAEEERRALCRDFVEILCHGWTVDGAVKLLAAWATDPDKHMNLKREWIEEPHPTFGRAVCSRKQFYVWRDEDKEFADDWRESYDIGTEALEDVGMNLAHAGSEKMIMFLLKARNPGRYANFGALGGGSFQVTFSPSDADL